MHFVTVLGSPFQQARPDQAVEHRPGGFGVAVDERTDSAFVEVRPWVCGGHAQPEPEVRIAVVVRRAEGDLNVVVESEVVTPFGEAVKVVGKSPVWLVADPACRLAEGQR